MQENYQFGPVSVSKSFVNQPFFWPTVVGVVLVALALTALKTGYISLPTKTPTPSIAAQVFPLDRSLSRPLLFSTGYDIYRTDGRSEEKLFLVGSEVLSLVPSRDGSRLAATYKTPSGGTSASGYPYTTLIMYDMNTKRSLPLIAQERTTVRFPLWSDDGRYLSFWVNDGEESFVYDISKRKAIYSVKREGSTSVSPIVFLPGTSGIVYVKNGTLYSAAADGTRPIALTDQVAATRLTAAGGNSLANPVLLSPTGSHLAYYTLSGDLMVVNTATRETKTVGSKIIGLGFLNAEELLYATDSDHTKQTPGLARFSVTSGTSTKIRNGRSFLARGAWPESAVLLTQQSQFYLPSFYPNLGPQLLDKDGKMEQDCSKADFHYTYDDTNDTRFPQAQEVVSPDGKYLLGTSGGSLAILDTATCQPYIISGTKPGVSTWMPL